MRENAVLMSLGHRWLGGFRLAIGGIAALCVAGGAQATERSLPAQSISYRLPSVASKLLPDLTPVDLKLLEPGKKPPAGVITSETISSTHLTDPSLWWIADQIASDTTYGSKFVLGWLAYRTQQGDPGRVDLVVSRQQWSLLDYLNRYEFINRFSAIVRHYGFNLRVFENQGELVAAFTCNYTGIDPNGFQLEPDPVSMPSDSALTLPADQLACKMVLDNAAIASYWELFKD